MVIDSSASASFSHDRFFRISGRSENPFADPGSSMGTGTHIFYRCGAIAPVSMNKKQAGSIVRNCEAEAAEKAEEAWMAASNATHE